MTGYLKYEQIKINNLKLRNFPADAWICLLEIVYQIEKKKKTKKKQGDHDDAREITAVRTK